MARRLYLPSAPDTIEVPWVEFKDKLPAGHYNDFREISKGIERIAEIMAGAIERWNITDDDGRLLPVTSQNLRLLDRESFWEIAKGMYPKYTDEELEIDVMSYLNRGDDKGIAPPWPYIVYCYRRQFRISWTEFINTPIRVIEQDMLFMSLESQYEANKPPE